MPSRVVLLLLLAATVFQTSQAQTCSPGYTLHVPSPGAEGQCCYSAFSTINADSCGIRPNWPNSSFATSGCSWMKKSEGVPGTFVVPPSGFTQVRIIARGSHGDYLDSATAADKQSGWGTQLEGIVSVNPGDRLSLRPGSYYGCIGCGQPTGTQYAASRNTSWTRGGALSLVSGGAWLLYAAGGGGQGQQGYRGMHADTGGPYRSIESGGAAQGGYGGGGGAGYQGGMANVNGSASGGAGGRSYWGRLPMTASLNDDPLDQKPAIEIHIQCIPALPATTVTTNVGQETRVETSTRYISTETIVLPTVTETSYTTIESAQPVSYTDSTFTPDPIPTTLTEFETTFPPTSTSYETSTPETSYFTETESIETTPATRTVYETFTPATSYFTETRTETISPGTVLETRTLTPPTRTVPASAQTTETVASGTLTSVVTSTSGNANCVQHRVVYPASCCPTAYIRGLAAQTSPPRFRRRHVLFARDYTTLTERVGTLTSTYTLDQVSTTISTPATETTTVTDTTPGPLTISTLISTAPASTETFYSTLTLEGLASTTTVTLTADAPSYTYTSTEYREAPTPLYTNISTADAPSSTATEVDFSTLPTPTQTVQEEAPTPLTTSTTTETVFVTVPAATATQTQKVKGSSCAVKTALTARCPVQILKAADQIVQVALLKTNRFLTGQPVIVDCGTAGTFYYS